MRRSDPSRWSAALAITATVLTFGGVALGTALEAQAPSSSIKPSDFTLIAAFLSLPAVGALLVWRRPGNAVGWLLATMGSLAGLYLTAHGWAGYALRTQPGALPGGTTAAWIVAWLLVPTIGLLPFVAAAFPSGAIEGARLRRFAPIAVAALAVLAAAQSVAPGKLDGFDPGVRPIANPLGLRALEAPVAVVTLIAALVLVVFAAGVIVNAVGRYRAASGDERRQLRGVAVFPAFIPASIIVSFLVPDAAIDPVIVGGQALGLVGLSVAMGIAVLRHGLYDLGDYVRRTGTYLALSAGVLVAIVAVASLAGVVLPVGGVLPATIAAAVVALALGPLRTRLQRGVDRLLFGQRDDPYAVLADVGASLEASLDPEGALSEMATTLARSLRVPYAAIEMDGRGGRAVQYGDDDGPTTAVPLVHQNRKVGQLVVGQRSADEPFTEHELRLLRDLARPVAVAVHAATLTDALQLARLELVRSREEERRRLRRDIHDGLGPTLAGTMLQLDALRSQISDESSAAIAATIKRNLRVMVDDVRRISHDLRPPALDDLGLVGALREQAHAFASNGRLAIDLDLPTGDPGLSAAVEVAVYRIVSEALTNVVRHADATRCTVRLAVGGRVDLVIVDDGAGVPDGSTPGVGLASIRERANELGGECTIEAIEPSGTRVHAVFPIGP